MIGWLPFGCWFLSFEVVARGAFSGGPQVVKALDKRQPGLSPQAGHRVADHTQVVARVGASGGPQVVESKESGSQSLHPLAGHM